MASTINTNIASLTAQRNLSTSQNSLNTAIQRLSSGLRINSAKDDAAGQAISDRFTSQIRGLNSAVRNANDGISLVQTTEGAMTEVSNNLQRIRELSVQAANATNTAADRTAIQSEIGQRIAEIDRIASQSQFNGIKLLDGTFSAQQIQVGANAGQTIGISATLNANTSSLGKTTFQTALIEKKAAVASDGSTGTTHGYKAYTATTITLDGVSIEVKEMAGSANTFASGTAASAAGEKAYGAHLAAAINARSGDTRILAEAQDNGDIKLIKLVGDTAISGGIKSGSAGTMEMTAADIDTGTAYGAQLAIRIADSALQDVNDARADMGALQNRFESSISNLQTTSLNLSASRSRIVDTDFASETANLTRGQILLQAGTAMLAQANSLPNGVLSLLRAD